MKVCKFENCNYPVFSHHYCRTHQYKRPDLRQPKKTTSKYPLPRGRPKKKPLRYKKKPTGELKMFMEIYSKNKHKWISTLTGKRLPGPKEPLFINCFAHLLPKGLYSKFRLYESNIILLTPEEHYLLDFSTKDKRIEYAVLNGLGTNGWDILEALIINLKQEYKL